MLSGRLRRPPRAREYIQVRDVGSLLPFVAVFAKSPGKEIALLRHRANDLVTNGVGSSFGK